MPSIFGPAFTKGSPVPRIHTHDVLIVGAGAAGLTLALELARRRLPFRLIEKLERPFAGSRGKGIQPRTQEVFEDLGVLDRVVAAGGVYPPQREYREDGTFTDSPSIDTSDARPGEPYHLALMVPQFLTEAVLRERLAELGHQVDFGHQLLAFEQDGDGVEARVAGPRGEELLRVRYLVGADGGRSFVRRTLGIEFEGKTLGVRAVVADVVLRGLGRDAWHRFNDGSMERQMSLCPLAGTELFQLQAPVPMQGEVAVSAGALNELVAGRTGRDDIVIDEVRWGSVYEMNARLAQRYRVDRVLLIGDAAHTHPPTGGQGLNTSIQDACNLAWKLGAVLAGAPAALLDTYEEERRPLAAEMLGMTRRLLQSTSQGTLKRGREVQQLDIGYAGSSLALDTRGPGRTLVAGDRAPDAACRGAAGQPRRLFELFRGTHWTLLCHGPVDAASRPMPRSGLHIHVLDARGDIVDEGGEFQSSYGVEAGDWVLVRPDGYVGAMLAAGDAVTLEPYLRSVGLGLHTGTTA